MATHHKFSQRFRKHQEQLEHSMKQKEDILLEHLGLLAEFLAYLLYHSLKGELF